VLLANVGTITRRHALARILRYRADKTDKRVTAKVQPIISWSRRHRQRINYISHMCELDLRVLIQVCRWIS